MISAVKSGADVNVGIDHEHYTHSVTPVADNYRQALANDLS